MCAIHSTSWLPAHFRSPLALVPTDCNAQCACLHNEELRATMALAQQNPATTLQNGMTFNPIPSTSSMLLPPRSENPVSPALPTTTGGVLTNTTTGTNPLTCLPCSGPGFIVGERGGRPSRQHGAPCEWGLRDPSVTRVPERLRICKHVGCVLTFVARDYSRSEFQVPRQLSQPLNSSRISDSEIVIP